jgi:hypothetical protein
MTVLRLEYWSLPVSVNDLYIVARGRKILSKEGRAWKTGFVGSMGGLSPQEFSQFQPYPDDMYSLDLWFYISQERLFSAGYGIDKRVLSPFANHDTSNLIKITEDAISELTGLRDRNNFDVSSHKRVADVRGERVLAVLQRLTVMQEGP